MTVGSRIKELRKQQKLTLRELARRADISHTFLSDIENNRSQPSLNRLRDIAEALQVKISYLLGENWDKVNEVNNRHYLPSSDPELVKLVKTLEKRPELRTLLNISKGLSQETIRQILKIVKTFKK